LAPAFKRGDNSKDWRRACGKQILNNLLTPVLKART
jgi:hypothetical protein